MSFHYPFLITTLMTIYKVYLEKSSNDSNKINQVFARILYNSYFQKVAMELLKKP